MHSQWNKIFFTAMLLVITRTIGFTQSVGIGTATPDVSSLLELNSASKGFLPPRMTAAQKVLIPSPKAGLIIYQTDGTAGLYLYNGASWIPATTSVAGAWTTTGNAGTTPGINFIGTTDNKSLLFKINNTNAGLLGVGGNTYWGFNSGNINSTGMSNVAIGNNALRQSTANSNLVAVGDSTLFNNGIGQGNTAIGSKALFTNAFGSNNVATGSQALFTNNGDNNTANGYHSLYSNNMGEQNTATGSKSMYANTSGAFNTAIGSQSLYDNTVGNDNTAAGSGSLASNTIGAGNTALGSFSLYNNISGNRNVAIGSLAGAANLTGNDNISVGNLTLYNSGTGHSNIAVGSSALYGNHTGNNNVAIGDSALLNVNADANVAVGSKSLLNNYNGVHNTAIGFNSALNNDGDNNTAVGFKSLYYNNNGNANTAVGYQSLYNNFDGQRNAAFGVFASGLNASGSDNSSFGYAALFSNTNGYSNVAVGAKALYSNLTGTNSVAVGDSALFHNLYVANTATGSMAMFNNTTGYYNEASGYRAMYSNTIGSQNTAIGASALSNNISGALNTALGYNADVSSDDLLNATAIGANATVACSNCLVLGPVNNDNPFTPRTKVDVGIGVASPQTDLHINPDGPGSILIGTNRSFGGYTNLEMGISSQSGGYSFIQSTQASGSAYGNLALNQAGGNVGIRTSTPGAPMHIKQSNEAYPVNGGGFRIERQTNTSHWDIGIDAGDDLDFTFNGITKTYLNNTSGGFTITSDLRVKKDIQLLGMVMPSIMQLEAKTYHYKDNKEAAPLSYGFIAQDVEKLFPDFVTTKGTDNIKGIAYQDFSVIAIKAIQEQQTTIDKLNDQVMELQAAMKELLLAIKK